MLHAEQLEDGTTVLIDVGGVVPAVAVYVCYQVGSAHESDDIAGAAHFLEHMLFKATEASGAVSERIEALGGEINAFTSYEQTVVHATVPLGAEAQAIELLLGMVKLPRLDPAEFEVERGVVVEELRGAKDDPGWLLGEAMRQRSWGGHPYGRPILGTEATLTAMRPATLRAFHDRAYRPDRLVVSVAGPVDPVATGAKIRSALGGGASRSTVGVPEAPARPVSSGCVVFDGGFDERLVQIEYPIPGPDHVDAPALDLLAAALGEGASALLVARLRYELDVAVSAWAGLELDPAGGTFTLGLAGREGRTLRAVADLVGIIENVRAQGVSAGALRRARAAVVADRLSARETVDGRAWRRAWYQAFMGDPRGDLAYDAAIQRVTPLDLVRVARTWLDPARAVVGAAAPAAEVQAEGLESAVASGLAAHRPAAPVVRRPGPQVDRRRLACGLTVVAESDPDAELAAFSLVGVGGTLLETARTTGLAQAWSSVVTAGAGDLGPVDFAEAVEERAGGMRAWSGRNSNGVSGAFPAADLRTGLELLGLLFTAPRFDEDEVARVRDDMREAQRLLADEPGSLAYDLAWSSLFPGHSWGRASVGTPASTTRVTQRRLRNHHRRVMQGSNLVLALAGAVDMDEVVAVLERVLASVAPGAPVPRRPPTVPDGFHRVRTRTVSRQSAPAAVVLGFPSTGHGHPDDPAAMLLAAVLGGASGTGRMFDRLREREGLVYDVSVGAERGLGGGALLCSAATDPLRAADVKRVFWEELDRIVDEPVDRGELDRVKAGLVDGAVLGLQRASSRADHLAAAERYGDGAERYLELLQRPGAVDADQLRAVAARVLRKDRCVEIIVGPGSV